MTYDAIIVGGGAAGLTAAAFLAKSGCSILLCEKELSCGGLVNSFERNGFVFDGGIRALENAGVLFRMVEKLGLDIEFVKNHVSVGIEDRVINVDSDADLATYGDLLKHFYPESAVEISAIIRDIGTIMHFMDIQYGIDNPLFLDPKEDREYFIKEVFPWMFRYLATVGKVTAKNKPVVDYLRNFTTNQSLLDNITQHFFTQTPAFFALSYLTLYQEYYYPKSGTGAFTCKLTEYIRQHQGEILTDTEIIAIDIESRTVTTADNKTFAYKNLLWAADQKKLYNSIDLASLTDPKTIAAVENKNRLLAGLVGNDSVFTLFLSVDLDKGYFENISAGHFFYTPDRAGLTGAGSLPANGTRLEIKTWLRKFFALTTYEIAIPVLRDASLAPLGKTGLIISSLFDYKLVEHIRKSGWDEEFRNFSAQLMITTLDKSIYPGLASAVIDAFTSTPLTLQKISGNTDGAITGWSFKNPTMPSENRLIRIASAVNTPLPHVLQAGQWTFSPSGFPVSLMTGKLAADKIIKLLKNNR